MANFTINSNKKSINAIHYRTSKGSAIPIASLWRDPLNKISLPNHILQLYSGSLIVQNLPNYSIGVSSVYNSMFFIPSQYLDFGITDFNANTMYYSSIFYMKNLID